MNSIAWNISSERCTHYYSRALPTNFTSATFGGVGVLFSHVFVCEKNISDRSLEYFHELWETARVRTEEELIKFRKVKVRVMDKWKAKVNLENQLLRTAGKYRPTWTRRGAWRYALYRVQSSCVSISYNKTTAMINCSRLDIRKGLFEAETVSEGCTRSTEDFSAGLLASSCLYRQLERL